MRSIFLVFAMLSSDRLIGEVTPQTLPIVLARAVPGQRIRLSPGNYGRIVLRDRHWNPAIEIYAGEASLTFTISGSEGVIVHEGIIGPANHPGIEGRGASIFQSKNITFSGSQFVDSRIGLVADQSSDIIISHASFRRMSADGVDIATSQRVLVENSSCADFIASGQHPDCIQMWSRPGRITSDVTLKNNVAQGAMQGFSGFNHVRDGVDDGGFDRINMIGNIVRSSYPNGVVIGDCRDCSIIGNRTDRAEGARWRVRVRTTNCLRCDIRDNKEG